MDDFTYEDRSQDCHCGNRSDTVTDGCCVLCRCKQHPKHGEALRDRLIAKFPFLEGKLEVPVRAHSRRGDSFGCGPMCTVIA